MRLCRDRNPPTEKADDWEDAKVAMQESGSWIKNADTKVTVLAAVLGVSLTVLAGRFDRIVGALREQGGCLSIFLIVGLAGVVVASITTLIFVAAALRPRTAKVSEGNRFSWPSMARRPFAPTAFPVASRASEAWEQAFALATIAEAKYRSFVRALHAFLGLILWIVVVLVVSAWIGYDSGV